MFGTFAITALLATLAGTAYADATPTVPGPGVVYKVGGTCHIQWNGDTASTTAWKNMAIELMTGDNYNMVHLTTVATGLDGTVTSTFDHPCPDVNPYSAIYFYQFSAPGASGKQWTTRFAIASASGQTTPPTNSTQPISGAAIPWGTGKLVDASSATPPPDFSNTGAGSSSTTVTSTSTPVSTSSTSSSSTATTSKGHTGHKGHWHFFGHKGTRDNVLIAPTWTPTADSSSSIPHPSKVDTVATSSASSSTLSSASDTPTSTPISSGSTSTPTPSKMVTVTTSKIPTSTSAPSAPSASSTTTSTPSSGSGKDNGAIGLDMKLWKTVVALGTSAMAFALL